MVQVPRTDTYICPVCSSTEWHYPEELSIEQTQEMEDEYQIE